MAVALLSVVPTALYCWLLWSLDRYEREPAYLLLATFFWGALPALVGAALLEGGVGSLAGDHLSNGLDATLVAPLVEEPLKAAALLGVFFFRRREFNGVLDGIIYGALVGFGFAMTENFFYLLDSGTDLILIWGLRALAFGFNHAFFTSIVGIGLGYIRFDQRRWLGYLVFPVALATAILLHAIHNASVQIGLSAACVSWFFNTSGVLVVVVVALLAQRRERHWIETQLTPEITSGIVDTSDLHTILEPSMRFLIPFTTFLHHGWRAFLHHRRFYQLLIELAYTKHRLYHGDRFCHQEDVDRLRSAVVASRALVPRG